MGTQPANWRWRPRKTLRDRIPRGLLGGMVARPSGGSYDFRHVAPGASASGVSLWAIGDAAEPCFVAPLPPVSNTRAKQATTTHAAPARFRAATQASLVAPLVSTSSTRTIRAPSIRRRWRGDMPMAPRSARLRADLPRPPSAGVRRSLRKPSTSSRASLARAISAASSAAWLNPLRQRRQR